MKKLILLLLLSIAMQNSFAGTGTTVVGNESEDLYLRFHPQAGGAKAKWLIPGETEIFKLSNVGFDASGKWRIDLPGAPDIKPRVEMYAPNRKIESTSEIRPDEFVGFAGSANKIKIVPNKTTYITYKGDAQTGISKTVSIPGNKSKFVKEKKEEKKPLSYDLKNTTHRLINRTDKIVNVWITFAHIKTMGLMAMEELVTYLTFGGLSAALHAERAALRSAAKKAGHKGIESMGKKALRDLLKESADEIPRRSLVKATGAAGQWLIKDSIFAMGARKLGSIFTKTAASKQVTNQTVNNIAEKIAARAMLQVTDANSLSAIAKRRLQMIADLKSGKVAEELVEGAYQSGIKKIDSALTAIDATGIRRHADDMTGQILKTKGATKAESKVVQEVNTLATKLDTLNGKIPKIRNQISTKRAELRKLNKQLRENKKSFAKDTATKRKEISTKITKVKTKLGELKEQSASIKSQINELSISTGTITKPVMTQADEAELVLRNSLDEVKSKIGTLNHSSHEITEEINMIQVQLKRGSDLTTKQLDEITEKQTLLLNKQKELFEQKQILQIEEHQIINKIEKSQKTTIKPPQKTTAPTFTKISDKLELEVQKGANLDIVLDNILTQPAYLKFEKAKTLQETTKYFDEVAKTYDEVMNATKQVRTEISWQRSMLEVEKKNIPQDLIDDISRLGKEIEHIEDVKITKLGEMQQKIFGLEKVKYETETTTKVALTSFDNIIQNSIGDLTAQAIKPKTLIKQLKTLREKINKISELKSNTLKIIDDTIDTLEKIPLIPKGQINRLKDVRTAISKNEGLKAVIAFIVVVESVLETVSTILLIQKIDIENEKTELEIIETQEEAEPGNTYLIDQSKNKTAKLKTLVANYTENVEKEVLLASEAAILYKIKNQLETEGKQNIQGFPEYNEIDLSIENYPMPLTATEETEITNDGFLNRTVMPSNWLTAYSNATGGGYHATLMPGQILWCRGGADIHNMFIGIHSGENDEGYIKYTKKFNIYNKDLSKITKKQNNKIWIPNKVTKKWTDIYFSVETDKVIIKATQPYKKPTLEEAKEYIQEAKALEVE